MNNFLTKLSRRERLYVLLAAAVLIVGGIFYPVFRATEKYRQEKLEELDAAQSLRASYQAMILSAEQIRSENSELKKVLSQADGLLFDRTGNDVMMEASITKMLNQMAPDLNLDISMARSSLRGVPGQLNFTVRGTGRYPEILNFFYQLETHRPLMIVDQFSVAVQGSKSPSDQGSKNPSNQGSKNSSDQKKKPSPQAKSQRTDELTEPRMKLQMKIHINCRTAAEGGK
ncbi:MAG: GspMb/PilO family protein [Kiritimatiellales bacterium]